MPLHSRPGRAAREAQRGRRRKPGGQPAPKQHAARWPPPRSGAAGGGPGSETPQSKDTGRAGPGIPAGAPSAGSVQEGSLSTAAVGVSVKPRPQTPDRETSRLEPMTFVQ